MDESDNCKRYARNKIQNIPGGKMAKAGLRLRCTDCSMRSEVRDRAHGKDTLKIPTFARKCHAHLSKIYFGYKP